MADASARGNPAVSTELAAPAIEAQLRAVRNGGRPWAETWAWYRAGEQLHLAGHGDASLDWPQTIAEQGLVKLCAGRGWLRFATGRGERVLGWLIAPATFADDESLQEFARSLGERAQTDALARAQNTQRVLYEIAYLASSLPDRAEFLRCVHERLGTLPDSSVA